MHQPKFETSRPIDQAQSLSARTARVIKRMIECDRRSWDRMLRQFAAEDRWVRNKVKRLFRPGQ